MGKVTGLPVVRIVRVRIADLRLGNLKPKEWRYLTPQEVAALKKPAGPITPKSVPEKPKATRYQKLKTTRRKPKAWRRNQ
jgi:hypothetical protein